MSRILSIPVDDRGLTLGVGLFETVLAVDGTPRLWTAHLARLARGCAALGLPSPNAATCADAVRDALDAEKLARGRAVLRLSWTGGPGERGLAPPIQPIPRLIVVAGPASMPPASLTLATVAVRRDPSSLTSRHKTLSYLDNVSARAEAVALGADEALMLDTAGRLACAAAANLFWGDDGVLFTPALSAGVLDGVVRGETLRLAAELGWTVREVEAPPTALRPELCAFLTNSLIGAVAVRALDGRALAPPDAPLNVLLTEVRDAVL